MITYHALPRVTSYNILNIRNLQIGCVSEGRTDYCKNIMVCEN